MQLFCDVELHKLNVGRLSIALKQLTVEEFDKLHQGIATSKIGLLDLEYAPLLRRAPEQKLQSTLRLLELKRRVWG